MTVKGDIAPLENSYKMGAGSCCSQLFPLVTLFINSVDFELFMKL